MKKIKNASHIVGQGGGKSGASPAGAVEKPDTLVSKAHIVVVDLIGEGEIGGLVIKPNSCAGNSIYLNGVALQNENGTYNFRNSTGITIKTKTGEVLPADINNDRQFTDIEWETRVGIPKQTVLKTLSIVETPYPVQNDGSAVTVDNPVTFLLNQLDATRASVVLTFPRMTLMDKTNGNIGPTSVAYTIDVSLNGGLTWGQSNSFELIGKCSSTYQRCHTFDLPALLAGAEGWVFRVSRVTPKGGSEVNNDIYFSSVTAIIDASLSYDNSALIAIGIDPLTFSAVPRREYLVDGIKIRVPRLETDGSWSFLNYDLKSSSNPAWILFDILTNERYGLGKYIKESDIDITDLFKIGKYCDELIPNGFKYNDGTDILEKRFEINTVIQQQAEAYRVLSDISSVFRGMTYPSNGKVGFTCDMPTAPSAIFTNANVIDGSFNYSGSARKDRHSAALITWNDPSNRYKQQIEYVEDAELIKKIGYRTVQTIAFGCSSRSQAHRVGRWILYTEAYETNLITFKTGIEGGLIFPGEVIEIHDQYRAGIRFGGRIVSINSSNKSITIDCPLSDKYGNGDAVLSDELRINITRLDGNKEVLTVNGVGDDRSVIFVHEAFDESNFGVNAVFIISNSNPAMLNPMLARVVGLTQESNSFEFNLTCVEHNNSKYSSIENGLVLQLPVTSVLSSGLTNSINPLIVVDEYTKFIAPRVLAYAILISWASNAGKYTLTYRVSTPVGDSSLPAVKDIRGVDVYPQKTNQDGTKQYTISEWIKAELTNQNYFEVVGGLDIGSVIDIAIFGTYPVTGKDTLTVSRSYTIIGATNDEARIKAPVNFIASTPLNDFNSIFLSWDNPIDSSLVSTAIYMSSTNNENTAKIYATVTSDSITIPDLPINSTWYFWAESIDSIGNHSFKTNHNPPSISTGIQGHTQSSYGDLMKKMSDDLLLSLSPADKFSFQSGLIGSVVDSKVSAAITTGLSSTIQGMISAATGSLNTSAYQQQLEAILSSLPEKVRLAVDTYTNTKLSTFQSSGTLDLSYTNNKIQEVLLSSESKSDNLLEQAIYSKRLEDGLATTFRDVFNRIAVHESKYINLSNAQEGILKTVETLAIDSSKGTAAIQKAEEVRVGELVSIANAFKQVISKVGETTARITTSEQTRATNDSALSQQMSAIQSTVDGVADAAIISSKKALVGWCEIGGAERLDLDTEAKCVAQSANGWHKGALGTAIDGIISQSTVPGGLNVAEVVQSTFTSAGANTSIGIFKSGVTVIANNAAAKAQTAEFSAAGIYCKYSDTSFDPFEIDDATLKNIGNSPTTLDTYCKDHGKTNKPLSIRANWSAQSGAYAQRLENLMSGNINARNTDGTLKPFAQIVVDAITDSSDAGSSATKKEALKSLTGGMTAIVNNASSVMTGSHCVKKDSSGNIISYLTQFTTQATCEAVINGGSWINEGAVATAIRQIQAANENVSTIAKISEALNVSVAQVVPASEKPTSYSNLAERIYYLDVSTKDASARIDEIQTGVVGYCIFNGVVNTGANYKNKALCEAAVGVGGVLGIWKDSALTANSIEQFSGFMNSLPPVAGSLTRPSNFALAIQNTITNALADPLNTATEAEKSANSTFAKLVNSVTAAKSNMAASVKHEITTQIGYCVVAAGTLDVDICDNKYVCACPVNKKSDGKTTTQYLNTDLTAGLTVGFGGVWHDGALASIVTGMSVASQLGSGSDGTLITAIGSALDEKYLQDQSMYQYNTNGSITYVYTGAPVVNGVPNYKDPPVGAVFPLDAYGNKTKVLIPGTLSLIGKNLSTLIVSAGENTASISESKTINVGVCQTNFYVYNAVNQVQTVNTAAIGQEIYDFSLDNTNWNNPDTNLLYHTSQWVETVTVARLNQQIASKFSQMNVNLTSVSNAVSGIKGTASLLLNSASNINVTRPDGSIVSAQVYTGFVVKQNTSATGVVHSDFIIQADRFAITNDTTLDLVNPYNSTGIEESGVVFPFIMKDGVINLNSSVIGKLALDKIEASLVTADKFISSDSAAVTIAVKKAMNDPTLDLKSTIAAVASAAPANSIFQQVLDKFNIPKGTDATSTQIEGSWIKSGTIAGDRIAAGQIIETPVLRAARIRNGFSMESSSYLTHTYLPSVSLLLDVGANDQLGIRQYRAGLYPPIFHGEGVNGVLNPLTNVNELATRIKTGANRCFKFSGHFSVQWAYLNAAKGAVAERVFYAGMNDIFDPFADGTVTGKTYNASATYIAFRPASFVPTLSLFYRNGGTWNLIKEFTSNSPCVTVPQGDLYFDGQYQGSAIPEISFNGMSGASSINVNHMHFLDISDLTTLEFAILPMPSSDVHVFGTMTIPATGNMNTAIQNKATLPHITGKMIISVDNW